MQQPSNHRIAIIGLGLIGGSLAAALKEYTQSVVIGFDSHQPAIERALEAGWIDEAATSLEQSVMTATLVVLCTPVLVSIESLKSIAPHLQNDTLVIDVGSTKSTITSAMETYLPSNVRAIGGHPMTGRITAEVDDISADLFHDTIFVLTPTSISTEQDITQMSAIIEAIGARPLVMTAEEHDLIAAQVSHIARVIPIALATSLQGNTHDAWEFAAGGFKQMTQGLMHDLSFWEDVWRTNPDGIAQALRHLSTELQNIATKFETGSIDEVVQQYEQARAIWTKRYGEIDK